MERYSAGWSLQDQIGQLLVAGFHGTSASADIIDLITNHRVGNIILFSRNVKSAQQLRALTSELQRIAREAGHRYPLLIMLDQENGVVRRLGQGTTIFPGNMTLGAVGSEELTYEIAFATGRELKALGVNMNLAPVLDVNNNPANPVIGVRSFGEDPWLVARLGAAAVRGYRAAGVLTSLKHFPGHGDTAVDSHLSLPVIPYKLERLERIELPPFVSGIEAGADSVMIAHMSIPELMKQTDLPSTISPEIVTGLLREGMDYEGVIITDCLEMKAVADTVGTAKGALLALQAGSDLLLISHHYDQQLAGLREIEHAVAEGNLAIETIEQAVERVLKLKHESLTWDEPEASDVINSAAHQQLSEHVYELSTTLVRDQDGLLPLKVEPEQSILVLLPQPAFYTRVVDQEEPGMDLASAIKSRHASVRVMMPKVSDNARDELLNAARQAAVTVVVTLNANLDSWQAQLVNDLRASGVSLVAIAAYNPYDLLAYPEVGTYLTIYENTPPAFAAAARVLFGEIPAQGHLPVSLPDM